MEMRREFLGKSLAAACVLTGLGKQSSASVHTGSNVSKPMQFASLPEDVRKTGSLPSYLHGPISNVFTTFNEDGSLDDEGQRRFLDAMIDTHAVSACFVRSGMGQMYTFSYDDVKQITKNACTHLKGKCPVLPGTSGIWDRNMRKLPDPKEYTKQAVELSQYAEEMGAAGVVLTIPDALSTGEAMTPGEAIDVTIRYLTAVSEAITIPIILYQSPSTEGVFSVSGESLPRLAQVPKVKAIKVSTTNAGYILDLCHATADMDFGFIVGNETAFYTGLCVGAVAVIGQGACMYPTILKAIQDCFDKGDFKGAIAAQHSAYLLVRSANDSVTFFKHYLNEKGYAMKPNSRKTDWDDYDIRAMFGGRSRSGNRNRGGGMEYDAYKQMMDAELEKYPVV